MTTHELLEMYRASEECKGFFLHADTQHALEVAESLLENENTYGYKTCPCRMASGEADKDADLVCPCEYRDEDVKEYGACYCHFFVDEAHKEDTDFYPDIDDRRPPEKWD